MVRPPLRVDPTLSNFRHMRQNQLLYVDKTAQIAAFLNHHNAQLFTRPRRFGKSLLLSTIEAMYSGDRELFGGAWAQPRTVRVPRGHVALAPTCRFAS